MMPDSLESGGALREPGEHAVDVPITCVLTRFRMRHPGQVLASYRDYWRVREQAREQVPGFLHAAFLVESPTTWISLSLWDSVAPIAHFGTDVFDHVTAARKGFSRLKLHDEGLELWSTKWRLESVSSNLNWPGFDLRGTILAHGREPGSAS